MVQFFKAGWGVFAWAGLLGFDAHRLLGDLIGILILIGIPFGLAARVPWRVTWMNIGLFVLMIVQSALAAADPANTKGGGGALHFIASLHVVNGLLILGGTIALNIRATAFARGSQTGSESVASQLVSRSAGNRTGFLGPCSGPADSANPTEKIGSNAGGCGVLGGCPPNEVRRRATAMRTLTKRPFGANVIIAAFDSSDADEEDREDMRERIKAAVDERVPILVPFWGDPAPFVSSAHANGVKVFVQTGSVEEAKSAAESGVDGDRTGSGGGRPRQSHRISVAGSTESDSSRQAFAGDCCWRNRGRRSGCPGDRFRSARCLHGNALCRQRRGLDPPRLQGAPCSESSRGHGPRDYLRRLVA